MAKAEKLIFNKTTIKPRSLTRKENKEFRKSGLHPNYQEKDARPRLDDMVDFILDHFYPNVDFDEAVNSDCVKLCTDTIALTYGQEAEEVKN
jgi:hypothetical protein